MRKIIDISRELFSCPPFPGDPTPYRETVATVDNDSCSLTAFYACAHNGTHIDAPCHFIKGGDDVDGVALDKCAGRCAVVSDADAALSAAYEGHTRILLRGADITPSEAEKLADKVVLLGMDAPSFGAGSSPAEVHRILLARGVVLLENLDLSAVRDGEYELIAFPLRLAGSDGSPVRAVLITED